TVDRVGTTIQEINREGVERDRGARRGRADRRIAVQRVAIRIDTIIEAQRVARRTESERERAAAFTTTSDAGRLIPRTGRRRRLQPRLLRLCNQRRRTRCIGEGSQAPQRRGQLGRRGIAILNSAGASSIAVSATRYAAQMESNEQGSQAQKARDFSD